MSERLCVDCGAAPAPVGKGTRCDACRKKRIVQLEKERYHLDPAFREKVAERKRAQFQRRMADPEKQAAHRARSREGMRRLRGDDPA